MIFVLFLLLAFSQIESFTAPWTCDSKCSKARKDAQKLFAAMQKEGCDGICQELVDMGYKGLKWIPPLRSLTSDSSEKEACYVAKSWWTNDCATLLTPVSGITSAAKCTGAGYTATCFGTPSKCTDEFITKKLCPQPGFCSGFECQERTLPPDVQRPSFKGPNCWDAAYGSRFGSNWAPSGRTNLEHYITPKTLAEITIYGKDADSPALSQWTKNGSPLKGCDAAIAVYHLFVCAIELLQEKKQRFAPPAGKAAEDGYTVDDFLGQEEPLMAALELTSFFAHKMKETARLTQWEEKTSNSYALPSAEYPPVAGQSYHGRGAVQLSYNVNYGPFSEWYFGDKMVLLEDPDKLDPEGPLGFVGAIWFWMTPRQYTQGFARCHDAVNYWIDRDMNNLYTDSVDYDSMSGFGMTTNIINGGIECQTATAGHKYRVAYFLSIASRMGLGLFGAASKSAKECNKDVWCNGLFRGCSPGNVAVCEAKATTCGDQFISTSEWKDTCLWASA